MSQDRESRRAFLKLGLAVSGSGIAASLGCAPDVQQPSEKDATAKKPSGNAAASDGEKRSPEIDLKYSSPDRGPLSHYRPSEFTVTWWRQCPTNDTWEQIDVHGLKN
ncbi:MAG: hypothetical protein N2C14_01330 [Planctomycetales bacterium]